MRGQPGQKASPTATGGGEFWGDGLLARPVWRRLRPGKGAVRLFHPLALGLRTARLPGMKLILAIFVYLLIGAVLSWGILLAMHGKPWLLIGSLIAYVVAFGKIGCTSH